MNETHTVIEVPNLLIVLGKNIGAGFSQEDVQRRHDHLSRESRMNAAAAGELWTPETDILFSGGQTAGPNIPPESAEMKAYFKRFYPYVPDANLLTEEKSIDTAGNSEEVAKMLADKHYRNIGLITVGYHLKNAEKLFENYGVKIDKAFASEDAITTRSHLHKSYAKHWAESDVAKKEQKREAMRRILLMADRKGKGLRLITNKTRR